ncbi:hypothetical protein MUK70_18995 [Dyadobacter chenwenxiniae]|uniref:Uncharacterized protein n=1 Tax=Dyadobacter chenwenxiniae TaxID=2906456 RepID=A0A9X1PIA8_9BACT|nr:hypothetical protein [Dyadobacter chenwenxiniae]MCF0061328.1 hypothetical protein [Dyadobacter chenwenxiniae]UON81150.1 hypothetical protein MUK70_18995 [Dyadobacter chenwenxiniae]
MKPLPQINFFDRGKVMYVHVQNNGVGPLIIEGLKFKKDGRVYTDIEECLDLPPRSYMHMRITGSSKKVILPGKFLEVFSTQFDVCEDDAKLDNVRRQLTVMALTVDGRDIYDNKIVLERDFAWFARHLHS